MAKSKKSDKSEAPAALTKKAVAKPAAPASAPLVDTSLVAQAAAKQLAAGVNTGAGGAPVPQSAAFKQMKQGLSKPHLSGLDSILDKSGGSKKSGLPSHAFGKQTGRNQTFGADVNRTGVPRRTGGG